MKRILSCKIRKAGIFMLAAMLLCTTSCIYDEITEDAPPHSGDGKAYIRIKVGFKDGNAMKTRTYEPSYEDEDSERKVSGFRVFLVKKDDPSAEVVELKDLPMLDETTTKPFEIDPAYTHGYLAYIVANAGSIEPKTTSGNDFRGEYALTESGCAKVWEPNHFLMVNVRNQIPEKDGEAPYGGVPLEIDEPGKYGIDNPFTLTITLERLAAKVVVNCDAGDYDFGGLYKDFPGFFKDVKIESVALINCVNRLYLIQRWRKTILYEEQWEDASKSESTPEGAPYGYPYLWCITPSSDVSYPTTSGYYNRFSDFTDFSSYSLKPEASGRFIPIDQKTNSVTMYCLENNSPNYLELWSAFDASKDDIGDDNQWQYAFGTKMRSRCTGVLFRVRAKVKADSHHTGEVIVDPEEGKWTTKSQLSASDEDYPTFYCYRKYVTSSLEALFRDNPSLTGKGLTASSSVKELRSAGVKVYENGYMYYVHWITDMNYKYLYTYKTEPDEADEFNDIAVLRNTRYEISVGSVSEIGMDLPGREVDNAGTVIEGNKYQLYPIVWGGWEFDEDILNELRK